MATFKGLMKMHENSISKGLLSSMKEAWYKCIFK